MKKIIIYFVLLISAIPIFSAPNVSFTLENRRVEGGDYVFDIYAEPSSEKWLVSPIDIIVEFNKDALRVGNYNLTEAIFLDSELVNAGYYATQAEYRYERLSINLLTLNPNVTKSDKFKLATFKLEIIDETKLDLMGITYYSSKVYAGEKKLVYTVTGGKSGFYIDSPNSVVIQEGDIDFEIATPQLHFPENNATDVNPLINLDWRAMTGSVNYTLEIDDNPNFTSPLLQKNLTISDYTVTPNLLNINSTYYWRVRAEDKNGNQSVSDIWTFTTGLFEHNIVLKEGWNLVSSFIIPSNSDIASVTSDLNHVLLVQNRENELYFPNLGIHSLSNWNYKEGYKIYSEAEDILTIKGNIVVPENELIELKSGWNTIAFLMGSKRDVHEVFQELEQSGDLLLIKDIYGRTYFPLLNLNTLNELVPGMGYEIYVTKNCSFKYPAY